MRIEIKNRYTDAVICTGETVREAAVANFSRLRGADLRKADLRKADLRKADLRGADLRGADLVGAYLVGADLVGADLRGANLVGADLRGANLVGADLGEAYLVGADLRGANLVGADLGEAYLVGADLREAYLRSPGDSAILAWQSHDLLAEILRRAAGDDIEKLKVAGLVLLQRGWCWKEFARLAAVDPLGEWALMTLTEWVQPDDDAPECLRIRKERIDAAT